MPKKKNKTKDLPLDIQRQIFVINALRRASYRWPPRNEASKKARVKRGIYRCEICKGEFRLKATQMDHVAPVLAVETGFVDWNTFIPRLFVDLAGWQRICRECHKKKTKTENATRRKYRKKRKELK